MSVWQKAVVGVSFEQDLLKQKQFPFSFYFYALIMIILIV